MRKTKVFGTLGPAVDSDQAVRQLILAGMDAVRFNFSHGTHAAHLVRLDRLKRVREELGRPVAAMLDSRGPEIRIRTFAAGPIRLRQGDAFILTGEDVPGDETRVSVTCGQLHEYVAPGCRVLLDDGLLELVVTRVEGPEIHCTVETGGELSNSKSIHIPGVSVPLPALTEQDERDLQFAAEQGFDMIAASHVRTAGDVEEIRAVLKKYGGESIRIIAKIENQEGLDNLDEILAVSDGVLVARGDLGVEIPVHQVPVVQKEITARAAALGKPVIVATQMLDSMMRNPRPTRAEVSDVANAVFDGVSCVLLTGETASGKYPLEALQTAVNTVMAAEEAMARWEKETMPG